jgi:hypothetical protein
MSTLSLVKDKKVIPTAQAECALASVLVPGMRMQVRVRVGHGAVSVAVGMDKIGMKKEVTVGENLLR